MPLPRRCSVAVPLALSHPSAELAYVLADAGISVVMASEEFAPVLRSLLGANGTVLVPLSDMAPGQARCCPSCGLATRGVSAARPASKQGAADARAARWLCGPKPKRRIAESPASLNAALGSTPRRGPQVAAPPAGAPDGAGVDGSEGALIIYTSGTTGRPKGALHTHSGLAAQARTLHPSSPPTPALGLLPIPQPASTPLRLLRRSCGT